ncbi:1-acyl-sn-glycerol-3-phosphate acyltransferase [Cyanobium sp. Morenito 9A2]|uniref:lysophospholipid acyltransferase family protein n=1 Tax=Cyanobium sp. Morenito 9A2 TaxID=2823718 RepID=UPI0020CBC36E|nr:lysophospholipid acyltransferase family protein [Cyanobium sp. Morenito 9A2]MCP9849000.1 1-acyl-sn-glycerol-3-phosphate acyltransferase [Cyanobium sp. Morenito 9A2]
MAPNLKVDRSPPVTAQTALIQRERRLCNGVNPWLAPIAVLLAQDGPLASFFSALTVLGPEHLPHNGPVLLAPTHRARWDALLLSSFAGQRVSGRHCRFMVTLTEMQGLQGWFLTRLGCFPVDQGRPGTAPLRYAVDLLAQGQQVVMFPEGHIRRTDEPIRLHQGLARLAVLARSQGLDVPVVPVGLGYSTSPPCWRGQGAICFGTALRVRGEGRTAVRDLNERLSLAMQSAEEAARAAVGRPIGTI